MDPLNDDELNLALARWRIPEPPAGLERRTIQACRATSRRAPSWLNWLTMEVRVPLPLALAMVLAIAALAAMLARFEFRRTPEQPSASSGAAWGGLRPVPELRPRIIRGQKNEDQ